MILALGSSSFHVNGPLGTTRLPGTTLFWLQKAKYDYNTDKISELRPRKHQVLSQFVYFCFGNKLFFSFVICSCVGLQVACVASVSVGFGSKERPRNGVFGILPARKMGREPKTERWGYHRPVILCSRTAQKRLLRRLACKVTEA